ncbi:hypothetical protein [Streptomyces sp. NPDC093225]|uniref:hypothetical protein n=1 Tax=Streptomyces sp. NPDC093225 TaxID=3366034 RepID=UPI003802EAB6
MSRRVSLPGADELFRTTGGMALQASSPRRQADPVHEDAAADDAAEGRAREGETAVTAVVEAAVTPQRRSQEGSATPAASSGSSRRKGGSRSRRPSGRERHDEKITVYVSAEELMDLEHARLVLRGEHGLAVDRGRIVREAVAVVLADLESRGDASILVRRLRGR